MPDKVWVSTYRRGVAYHGMRPGWQTTICGRYYGRIEDSGRPERGEVLTEEQARADLGAERCARCYGLGELVQPNVVRSTR